MVLYSIIQGQAVAATVPAAAPAAEIGVGLEIDMYGSLIFFWTQHDPQTSLPLVCSAPPPGYVAVASMPSRAPELPCYFYCTQWVSQVVTTARPSCYHCHCCNWAQCISWNLNVTVINRFVFWAGSENTILLWGGGFNLAMHFLKISDFSAKLGRVTQICRKICLVQVWSRSTNLTIHR